jgi:hypothetical protein
MVRAFKQGRIVSFRRHIEFQPEELLCAILRCAPLPSFASVTENFLYRLCRATKDPARVISSPEKSFSPDLSALAMLNKA